MENKEKNFASAVIYVHNAENRIEEFLKMIISVMEDNFEHSEIICVNDGSVDYSLSLIKKVSLNAKTTSVSVVNMSGFHGLELAMNAGMDMAIGDFVFEFDNTFIDYDKSEIMNIYNRSLQGYDIVSAAPDRKERFTSRLFYKAFRRFTNVQTSMHTESFRVLSRRVINRINSMNKTVPYRKAIYASTGLRTDTIIYKPLLDKNYSNLDKVENKYRSGLAVDSLILFTELGYRLSIAMTVLMMVMSVFMIIYSIVIYATAHPVEGWTTTVLFLSVAFFGLFGILTVIIKYLQLLINLVFKRKQYSFESIEKLTK
jgi:dolichol-phosphate mannosyltransferase